MISSASIMIICSKSRVHRYSQKDNKKTKYNIKKASFTLHICAVHLALPEYRQTRTADVRTSRLLYG